MPDDGRDALGDDLAGGDVVGHEERLGAAHDDVVDDHADQVEADGVVPVEGLGDGDLGADAVGARGEHGAGHPGERAGVEQPGEAAQATEHLGPGGPAHRSFISSTALSPASTSTPAAAYVMGPLHLIASHAGHCMPCPSGQAQGVLGAAGDPERHALDVADEAGRFGVDVALGRGQIDRKGFEQVLADPAVLGQGTG
jgi:hypothetical protein